MYARFFLQQQTQGIRSIAPKIRIIKNVLVLSFAFMLAQATFAPLRTYLSISTHAKAMGPITMAICYGAAILSGFWATFLLERHSTKWTIILCISPYLVFLGPIAYFQYFTMVPASLLLGLTQAPLYCSIIAYLINSGGHLAYLSLNAQQRIIEQFLSVFNAFAGAGTAIGHLISAATFPVDGSDGRTLNVTENLILRTVRDEFLYQQLPKQQAHGCGRWFCNSEQQKMFPVFQKKLSASEESLSQIIPVYSLSVFAGMCACAPVILVTLLDKLTVQVSTVHHALVAKPSNASQVKFSLKLWSTFKNRHFQCIIPMFLYIGIGEAFMACDVTKAFAYCCASKSMIGYLMFGYGFISALSCFSLGAVLNHIQRLTVASAGFMFQLGSLFVMWIWSPVPDDSAVLFVIVTSYAMGESIWKMLSQTMICRIFSETWEAPFAASFMVFSCGLCFGFVLCPYSCIEYKIYFQAICLVLSLTSFGFLERKIVADEAQSFYTGDVQL